MKTCRVWYRDMDGMEHAVELEAMSLYEAVGLAIDRVEPREPGTQHKMTRKMFDEWMRRTGGSPRDVATRNRLKAILHGYD